MRRVGMMDLLASDGRFPVVRRNREHTGKRHEHGGSTSRYSRNTTLASEAGIAMTLIGYVTSGIAIQPGPPVASLTAWAMSESPSWVTNSIRTPGPMSGAKL